MSILYIILALFGLGLLVFIHELGHYFVAKWAKMEVEIFSIGFGRALLRWKRGDVTWQIGWLPFGGYVKIKGMELTKKSKTEYVDPYTIKDGFFSKSPAKRIAVAIAGPLANFILAFLIFTAIWAFGGREKPFSEFTQIVGWVDPKSELYAKGLRPGDLLASYDQKPYRSSKDLLYAAIFSGKEVELKGAHVNWKTGEKSPFTYTIQPYSAKNGIEGMMTTGIGNNARYLIYEQAETAFVSGSPMKESGLEPEDRLVWADGELLFSVEQLNHLINQNYALLTVEREGKTFLSRQPRLSARNLLLSSHAKGELADWQYEAGIQKRLQELMVLPYEVNEKGYIESKYRFIDDESKTGVFALYSYSEAEEPLQKGDRILAIDGSPFVNPPKMLEALQEHKVHMIVQEDVPLITKTLWKQGDSLFERDFKVAAIEELASSIGRFETEVEGVRLLKPVTPALLSQLASKKQLEEKEREILAIDDQTKREVAMKNFTKQREQRLLGIHLQDRLVAYNPGPFALLASIFAETGQTLKALITGNLHPRWLSGPVGIVQVMHHGWTIGIKEALFWVAAISINLGFLNLLPIPVLDGGYLCLSLFEMITKKKISPKTMERMIIPFVILLIGLLLFLTFQDVLRLF